MADDEQQKIEPQFVTPSAPTEPPLTDGEFIHFLKLATKPAERIAVLRRMVLRKYGEMSALIYAGIDDDFARSETSAFLSLSLGGAMDAILPVKPDESRT